MPIESQGFDEMAATMSVDVAAVGAEEWRAATDIFFGRTQERVHVVTGALKASGAADVLTSGDDVVGEVSYGGGLVDYALAEQRRGPEHDYLNPAFVDSQPDFEAALGRTFERVMGGS